MMLSTLLLGAILLQTTSSFIPKPLACFQDELLSSAIVRRHVLKRDWKEDVVRSDQQQQQEEKEDVVVDKLNQEKFLVDMDRELDQLEAMSKQTTSEATLVLSTTWTPKALRHIKALEELAERSTTITKEYEKEIAKLQSTPTRTTGSSTYSGLTSPTRAMSVVAAVVAAGMVLIAPDGATIWSNAVDAAQSLDINKLVDFDASAWTERAGELNAALRVQVSNIQIPAMPRLVVPEGLDTSALAEQVRGIHVSAREQLETLLPSMVDTTSALTERATEFQQAAAVQFASFVSALKTNAKELEEAATSQQAKLEGVATSALSSFQAPSFDTTALLNGWNRLQESAMTSLASVDVPSFDLPQVDMTVLEQGARQLQDHVGSTTALIASTLSERAQEIRDGAQAALTSVKVPSSIDTSVLANHAKQLEEVATAKLSAIQMPSVDTSGWSGRVQDVEDAVHAQLASVKVPSIELPVLHDASSVLKEHARDAHDASTTMTLATTEMNEFEFPSYEDFW